MSMTPRQWRSLISATVMAIATTLATAISPATAKLEDSPKALVDQAWQIVHQEYADRSFNDKDWLAVRQQYLSQPYSSTDQAYLAVDQMLKQLGDPYTRFLTPAGMKDIVDNVSGDFIGVGVTVTLDPLTQEWVVLEVAPGSPAANVGISKQDIVVSINGKQTASINPRQASQYIIGPVGSKVALQVRRGRDFLVHQLVREHIDLNPLIYGVQSTDKGKFGYIRMPVFTTKSTKAMEQALITLEKQQVQGYLLDLRHNPGGVFEASIDIARLWMGSGQVISSILQRGQKEVFRAPGPGYTAKPLVVLVDEQSASASEVLAAALQDNRRAPIVGTKTFGKGIVQNLKALTDGSGVVVTTAQYFTPKGKNIHKIGLTPDLIVNLPEGTSFKPKASEVLPPLTDQQYARALKLLTKQTRP
ncbi:MAG: PDZ domain-containing protein [Acaryochloridaceae cyanobacterium SU_2_1]|nr:PDZ domain-containing protein [Acaryochloridaceae cyanobacterium SU_2_1]